MYHGSENKGVGQLRGKAARLPRSVFAYVNTRFSYGVAHIIRSFWTLLHILYHMVFQSNREKLAICHSHPSKAQIGLCIRPV